MDDGANALVTIYRWQPYDLGRWGIVGPGYILESLFQEIEVNTNKVLFQWSSLSHIGPEESHVFPNTNDISGTGTYPESPWDYFHINSVDKNQNGDYLVSARHTSTVYKISGSDGQVLWRLNGEISSFTNRNFSFSNQHDARWIYENATHSILSLFNNGSDGFNKTSKKSSGMIISIDHSDMTASLLHEYSLALGHRHISGDRQGNVQLLADGNVFQGWGNDYVSEHDAHGKLLFWGKFPDPWAKSYRAFKFDWNATPIDSPDLKALRVISSPSSMKNFATDISMTLHVSWNGATQVRFWKVFGSKHTLPDKNHRFDELITVPKTGFETTISLLVLFDWIYVEALGEKGVVLARSNIVQANAQPAVAPNTDSHAVSEGLDAQHQNSSQNIINHLGRLQSRPTDLEQLGHLAEFGLIGAALVFSACLVVYRWGLHRGARKELRWMSLANTPENDEDF